MCATKTFPKEELGTETRYQCLDVTCSRYGSGFCTNDGFITKDITKVSIIGQLGVLMLLLKNQKEQMWKRSL
ncbi:hypothetical protein F2Q68_00032242 [Brassica cretica]|uniref:Uncharacterized protein n=1 Tax=Brassica cretica TaxID=69181 RepID=A0A8S9GK68_BRACR|nr:hypothetical protein F2Q68_00032242 [Brassica cretica]